MRHLKNTTKSMNLILSRWVNNLVGKQEMGKNNLVGKQEVGKNNSVDK